MIIQFTGKTYLINIMRYILVKFNKVILFFLSGFNHRNYLIEYNYERKKKQKNYSIDEEEVNILPFYENEEDKKNKFVDFIIKKTMYFPLIGKEKLIYRFLKIYLSENEFISEGIFSRKSQFNIKKRLKLFYIYLFPYSILLYKIFFSKFTIYILEILLNLTSEKEPCLNILYRKIITYQEDFMSNNNWYDYLNLFIFIFPNTLMILYSHLNEKPLNFFIQNFCISNIFPLFFYGNLDILIIGLFNILIIVNKFSADYETYSQFSLWFDFFGIEPMDR